MDKENNEKKPYKSGLFGPPREDYPNIFLNRVFFKIVNAVDKPITWFREKVVLPNRPEPYAYYHRKFRRVPTVDTCYADDTVCVYEANEQYKRDRQVDEEILKILQNRWRNCVEFFGRDEYHKCLHLNADLQDARLNYFIKYGDIAYSGNVTDVFMKQKHRLIWERRQALKNKVKNFEDS